MDTIDVFRTANFESEDAFEILGCSAPADKVTLTNAYRDLSRKVRAIILVEATDASLRLVGCLFEIADD